MTLLCIIYIIYINLSDNSYLCGSSIFVNKVDKLQHSVLQIQITFNILSAVALNIYEVKVKEINYLLNKYWPMANHPSMLDIGWIFQNLCVDFYH